MLERFFNHIWYGKSVFAYFLLPLSLVFYGLSRLRREYLKRHAPAPLTVPVIVVGNISVGGTGKTPVIISLVEALKQQGLKPAVISRGYGGDAPYPYVLQSHSTAKEAGDEPLLIYRRCHCPVVVSPKRLEAAQYVSAHFDVDVILSDDGLQHYALPRVMELAVIDGQRGLGNGFCLPAGPLRETASRLKSLDAVIINGDSAAHYHNKQYVLHIATQALKALPKTTTELDTGAVHAVAGIGHPERFFCSLEQLGFQLERHSFADHHQFSADELLFADDKPVVMTEKDAVKCMALAGLTRHWYLPIEAILPEALITQIMTQLKRSA